MPRTSPRTPPTPDRDHWAVGYVSSNGAGSDARRERALRIVVLGYITAVAIPPVGFILGIIVATRPNRTNAKHGVAIIVISLIASVLWVLVLASGVFTPSTNDLNY